jgi:NitT/TauT family transport system substrate-binding protein
MFTSDGVMPANGPQTVLNVLSTFNPDIHKSSINLGLTYTTAFVQHANSN